MKNEKLTLPIRPIEYGTVIDHIPSENTLKVIEILNLEMASDRVFIAFNVESHEMSESKKGLIKIEGRELTEEESEKLVLLAPEGTINLIKNSKVASKHHIKIPDMIEGIMRGCPNIKCISNIEKKAVTRFKVLNHKKMEMSCYYCEKSFTKEDIIEYI
jgi:aspartate carbamoyltransferase regulatory subunit